MTNMAAAVQRESRLRGIQLLITLKTDTERTSKTGNQSAANEEFYTLTVEVSGDRGGEEEEEDLL